jgi:hypothetical protein
MIALVSKLGQVFVAGNNKEIGKIIDREFTMLNF